MELYIANNHFFVQANEYMLLIDTGSEKSFGFNKDMKVFLYEGIDETTDKGVAFTIKHNPLMIKHKKYVDELTGLDVDGFIGLDIIKQTGLTIDFVSRVVTFNSYIDKSETNEFKSMEFNDSNGPIEINNKLKANGQVLNKVIIDTGAYVSYFDAKFINKNDVTQYVYYDYNPLIGEIEDKLYKVNVNLVDDIKNGGRKIEYVGILNPAFCYYNAIVNPVLISNKIVIFDFEHKIIKYK